MNTATHDDTSLGCILNSIFAAALIVILVVLGVGALAGAVTSPEEATQIAQEATAAAQVTDTPPPTNTAAPLPTSTPVPTLPPTATAAPTAVAAAVQPAGNAAGGAYDPAKVAEGEMVFNSLCSACHGLDARGLPNLGKNLVDSEFVHGISDEELLNFVKTGRPIWDPANTTGIDMPPKGGNPALTDDQLMSIIAYLRSISTTQ